MITQFAKLLFGAAAFGSATTAAAIAIALVGLWLAGPLMNVDHNVQVAGGNYAMRGAAR